MQEFVILKLANIWGRGVVSGDIFWGSYWIDEDSQPEEHWIKASNGIMY